MDVAQDSVNEPSTKLRLRSYQQEMLEASLEKNIIVAMDTGSGKTHIAIARILVELERSKKLVWFLSPSVALAMQQADVLSTHLPAYHVRTLTGLDGVDKWTDQDLWNATLTNVHVVVGTPAVLLDALTHGFVKIGRLGLCIFDEAHRTTKGHPMNSIMRLFYHPTRQQGQPVPHILGLTASPVVNSKKGSLETIESNLNAIAITPKRNREEFEVHVNAPVLATVVYDRQTIDYSGELDSTLNALAAAAQSYDFSKDPYVVELNELTDPRSRKELEKILTKRETYCWTNLRALDLRAQTMREQLGTTMSRWYIGACISRFREGMSSESIIMPDLSEKERKHLVQIFDSVCPQNMDSSVTELHLSEKVEKLLQILRQHARSTTRGIVFVEQRVQVTALAKLLEYSSDVSHKVATFVGTSASTKRKISVADLVAIKDQEKDLAAFRSGEKNLMIATNVLEEGIDVSACNLVICFDPPKNLVSFVQRRGRARQKDSHYYLFVPNDQVHDKQWAALEAEMKKAYMDDTRQLTTRLDDDLALSNKVYQVASTGAMLTLENAKAHLYHFCSITTQASSYLDIRPEFDTEEHPGDAPDKKLWSASVYLPSSVHADLRSATSTTQWQSENAAIADAAFEAYVALHRAGLINDNLLPRVKDYGPETGQQHINQPSIVQIAGRQLPFKELYQAQVPAQQPLSSYQVTVCCQDSVLCETVLWLPSKQLPRLDFDLYWNERDVYVVTLDGDNVMQEPVDDNSRSILQTCTRVLLSSVHGTRMSNEASDFPVLFGPKSVPNISQWTQTVSGARQAGECSAGSHDQHDVGLVRINGQIGHAYMFQGFQSSPDLNSDLELVITPFPKRKDFLHPIPKVNVTAAYSSKQTIKAHECTIDNLPARYAVFAAFVPSILHRVETVLLAINLQTSALQRVQISDLSLLLEAISAPSAAESHFQTSLAFNQDKDMGKSMDYNRLEYLGDTILKHCTELQVMAQHGRWPESYLTLERDRIVRNSNLAQAAVSLGLDKYILTKPFTGSKWRPPYISELLTMESVTREISSKTLADVVEASIGAAYVDGGLDKGLLCIETLLPSETWLSPDHCFNILTQDLEPTKATNFELLEHLIGHDFQHVTLLAEAITHVSYSYNRTGLSYERLEFLGDSVLDMIITPKLFAHPRNLRHWELHRIHEALVNSHFLGFCCMACAINEEKFSVVDETSETGEETQQVKQTTRRVHLHDFLKIGPQLVPLRRKSIALFDELRPAIEDALQTGKDYPWPDLVALNPQKFFCDLVESVLGALYIDTRGDMAVCEAFVEKLGILKYMQRILDGYVECFSPKERLGVVADRDEVKYVNSRREDESGRKMFSCTVTVGQEDVVTVDGCRHKDEAEVKAAHQACKILEARGGGVRNGRKRKYSVAAVEEAEDGAMDVDSPEA